MHAAGQAGRVSDPLPASAHPRPCPCLAQAVRRPGSLDWQAHRLPPRDHKALLGLLQAERAAGRCGPACTRGGGGGAPGRCAGRQGLQTRAGKCADVHQPCLGQTACRKRCRRAATGRPWPTQPVCPPGPRPACGPARLSCAVRPLWQVVPSSARRLGVG